MKSFRFILASCATILLCGTLNANIQTDTTSIVWSDDDYQTTYSDSSQWISIDSLKRQTLNREELKKQDVFQPAPKNKKKSEVQSVAVKKKADSKAQPSQAWKPNAQQALWLGVIIPGAGQIYNRMYWKLPIVYGGLMGCAYAISWNGRLYNDYKQAYIDILSTNDYSDPNASFIKVLPKGYTIESMGGVSNYTNVLNNRQNTYRRNRDLGIIAAVAVYALSLIDAYVDAQLFNFDISPDLTLNVKPNVEYDMFNQRSTELHLTLNF